MTIDSRTRVVGWTPGPDDIGTISVTILVIDGHGGKVTQTFTILVSPEPKPVKTDTQATTSLLIFVLFIIALVGVMVGLSARHHGRH